MTTTKRRSYSELQRLESFEDRFDYLALKGLVGARTFGFDRWMNQLFYASVEWQNARREVVVRDMACDLGVEGYNILTGGIFVHHMNPMTIDDIQHGEDWLIDPEYLITTSRNTHNAIHYGDKSLLPRPPVARMAGDTTLW